MSDKRSIPQLKAQVFVIFPCVNRPGLLDIDYSGRELLPISSDIPDVCNSSSLSPESLQLKKQSSVGNVTASPSL